MEKLKGWKKLLHYKFLAHCQTYPRAGPSSLRGARLAKLASYIYGGAWSSIDSPFNVPLAAQFLYHVVLRDQCARDRRYIRDIFTAIGQPELPDELEVRRQVVLRSVERLGYDVPGRNGPPAAEGIHAFNLAAIRRQESYEHSSEALYRLAQYYNVLAHHFDASPEFSWKVGFLYDRKSAALVRLVELYPAETRVEVDPMEPEWLLIGRAPLGCLHIPLRDVPEPIRTLTASVA